MTEVELPDGTILEFPDGMSRDQMKQAVDRHLGRAAPFTPGGEAMRARGMTSPDPTAANALAQGNMQSAMDAGTVAANPLAARVGAFSKGVPFIGEYYDEAVGAIGGDAAKDRVRTIQSAFERNNPRENLALGIGGGVVGSLPALGAVGPVAAATSRMGLGLRSVIGAGAGAVAGATEGAVSGYGAGEGDTRGESAMERGLIGGAVGMGVGAAAPMVAEGVSRFVQYLKGADIPAIAQSLGIRPDAAKAIKVALEAEDVGRAVANINRGGPDAMLAEAGPATQALASGTMASGGRATSIIRDAIDDRVTKGAAGVRSAMDDAFKPGTSLIPRPPKLGTAYDAAYRKPIDYSTPQGSSIERLWGRVPNEVKARARKLIEMDPDIPDDIKEQFLISIQPDGSSVIGKLPSVLELDYATRSLNDVAKRGDGMGALGGSTNEGRLYGNLSRALRENVKKIVPEYRQALDYASTEIGIQQAREFGQTAMRANVTRADVLESLKGAPLSERLAMKAAVRQTIDDQLANVRRTMSKAGADTDVREAIKGVKDLSSRSARAKLATILGPKEAVKLTRELDKAATAFEIGDALARNSDTAIRQAVQKSVDESASPSVVSRLLAGEPVNATQRFAQIFTGATPEAEAAVKAGIYEDIARALTQTKGPNASRALQGIRQVMAGQAVTEKRAQEIARLTVTALGGLAYQAGTQER